MIVTNLKEVKTNIFEITFDNVMKINLYDETIINYNLVVSKVVNDSLFEEIKKYNDLMIIFFKYRKFLLKKIMSKFSLIKLLEKEDISDKQIDSIITKYEKLNLINDNIFLESFINDKINLTLMGPDKIKKYLLSENIDENKIINQLNKYDNEFWNNRINKIINKKKKANHKDSLKVFEYKVKNYLFSLGYSNINYELDCNDEKEILILTKEYNKLIKKYEKEIVFKKLLNKGFKYEDIKKLEI